MSAPYPPQQQQPYGYPPPVQQPDAYPPQAQNYGYNAAYPPPTQTYPVPPPSYENATQPTAPLQSTQWPKQTAPDVEYGGEHSFDTTILSFSDRTIRRGKTL